VDAQLERKRRIYVCRESQRVMMRAKSIPIRRAIAMALSVWVIALAPMALVSGAQAAPGASEIRTPWRTTACS